MAEVISLLGQISNIVELSRELISCCCALISSTKDGPKELEEVRREVTSFEHNVVELRERISMLPEIVGYLNWPQDVLQQGFDILDGFVELLQARTYSSKMGPKRAKVMSSILDKVEWPHKKTALKDGLLRLARCRDTIHFSLSTALTKPVLETREEVTVINKGVVTLGESIKTLGDDNTRYHDEARRLDALRWFNVDQKRNKDLHKERLVQQEKSTCDWFTRDEACHWGRWMQGQAFIWITGMPGTGKSVLASYLIEQAGMALSRKGVAYYYCYWERNHDESIPLLRHIVKQLIGHTDHVPSRIYERHRSVEALDTEDLLDCVAELSHRFQSGIRVIVDAVDESKPRSNLIDILFELGTNPRFHMLSLLVTSRPEPDIEARMENQEKIVQVSMANSGVQADIQRLVRSELSQMPWPKPFIQEIEQCLVGGARGMFRWVACQLHSLKEKGNSEQAVRDALRNLPKDIYETYERILLGIRDEDRDFTRTALALLCSGHGDFPTAEVLVEACLYRVRGEYISTYDVSSLAKICGCLLRISDLRRVSESAFAQANGKETSRGPFHKVSLAHYTVKEYLVHPKTAKGPAKFFALSQDFLETIDLIVAFKGLQRFGFRYSIVGGSKPLIVTRYEEDCLTKTETALHQRRHVLNKNEELYQAVLQSLKPSSQHATHLRQQNTFVVKAMKSEFPTWEELIYQLDIPPSGRRSDQVGLLLNLTTLQWYTMLNKYLKSHEEFTKLHRNDRATIWTTTFKLRDTKNEPPTQRESLLLFCVRRRLLKYLQAFISHGTSFRCEPEILYAAMYSPYEPDTWSKQTLQFLKAMLDHGVGANPNPVPNLPHNRVLSPDQRPILRQQFAFTPLQVAVALNEQDWVEELLEARADPNGTGSPGGQIPHGWKYGKGLENIGIGILESKGGCTPLEICRMINPPEHGKSPVESLLERWRATEGSAVRKPLGNQSEPILIPDDVQE